MTEKKKGQNLLLRLSQLLLRFSPRHSPISSHFDAKSYDIWYHEIVRSHFTNNLTKIVHIIFYTETIYDIIFCFLSTIQQNVTSTQGTMKSSWLPLKMTIFTVGWPGFQLNNIERYTTCVKFYRLINPFKNERNIPICYRDISKFHLSNFLS